MASNSKSRIFASDFETTVYNEQKYTEVWASASVELGTEDDNIFHSIEDQLDYFTSLKSNIIVYYHNIKFDGNFWLSFFLDKLKFAQAIEFYDDGKTNGRWVDKRDMKNKSIRYTISSQGQWYVILVKYKNRYIEFRDSYKLLPYSLKRIGESFKTKHRKLDMEYEGFRWAGCPITDDEKEYIKGDVLVLKEALEMMYQSGHDKLTIGACCLSEFKKSFFEGEYDTMLPKLTVEPIPEEYGSLNVDEYVRRSYRGGWCYVVEEKAKRIYHNGSTFDVNSLYPSMMESSSGNYYPYGKPKFWKGNFIPEEAYTNNRYYFVRFKTRFYLKKGYLPFVQIKGNPFYKGNENLRTSDIFDYKTKRYYTHYTDSSGNQHEANVTLTMTMTDYKLFLEHYHTKNLEILDGCWFNTTIGLFDEYIKRYKEQKMTSKGAKREEAKLFLNNLYGKMASSENSSFKVAYINNDGVLQFYTIPAFEKTVGYIPIGSAITSYARNFTIRTAQKNYYGADNPGFIYADTDSIHCDLPPDKIKGLNVHPTNFSCWSNECNWDEAIFVRQKTYIEHVIEKDGIPVESPYYDIKCAGMSERPKYLFLKSMLQDYNPLLFTPEELDFISTPRTISDFEIGLEIPSKLMPVRIPGGIVLKPTTYKLRPRLY